MKKYLAVIDFEHLENPIFLKSLAQSLSRHGTRKGILIHGDSEYTDRLIQTGMMRDDARKRAIMDLNRRLVTLFADHGVSAIGLNSFQKELISITDGEMQLNEKALASIPQTPILLLSSLVANNDTNESTYISPFELAAFLSSQFEDHQITLFSQYDKAELFTNSDHNQHYRWEELSADFIEKHLTNEQMVSKNESLLTTSLAFAEWPEPKNSTFIK